MDIALQPKQRIGFTTEATEFLYGGAAGGGKSVLLRASLIRWCMEVPGIQVYLFRRTLRDLRDNHLRGPFSFFYMLGELLKSGHCRYRAVENEFSFWNGSVLHLCYCDSEGDVENYRGSEMHILAIDELTHFCVHPDTDVLTEAGWKNITELTTADFLATIAKNKKIEYQQVEEINAFDYDGDLLEVKQRRGISFSVTPNHKCVIEPQKSGDWRFCRADQLPEYSFHVTGGQWVGRENKKPWKLVAPSGRGIGTNQNSALEIPMDDWLEFLGWYLSEGCSFEAGKRKTPTVCIRQTKNADDLIALFKRLPFKSSISKDGQYRIFSRQLYTCLKKVAPGSAKTKRIPRFIFSLSVRQIRIFWDAFVRGDGHLYANGAIGIGLCNEQLIDDLQHLAILLGLEATKGFSKAREFDSHRLSVRKPKRPAVCVPKKLINKVRFVGQVWCPTVKNHNFISRLNGRVVVTGNTEFQFRFLRHRVRIAGLPVPEQYRGRLPRIECGSNPGSVGHAWVKRTFINPKPPLEIWRCAPDEGGMLRQFIPAHLSDNIHLMRDDPAYADRLRGMGSEHLVRAQLEGDWNILAGQAFEKLRRDVHGLEPFEPPKDWQIFGSLDWGSSRPFSFGLWCVANGDDLPSGKAIQRGAIIRFAEWYGWDGKPNEGLRLEVAEVADGMKAKLDGRKPAYIIADPSVWKVDGGPSHAETMLGRGVVLRRGDNSRIAGYLAVRDRIAGNEDGPMLYATTNCHDGFWRTMPDIVMDSRHVEDVSTDNEDHVYDETRYSCMSRPWIRTVDKPREAPDRWMRAFEREDVAANEWKVV